MPLFEQVMTISSFISLLNPLQQKFVFKSSIGFFEITSTTISSISSHTSSFSVPERVSSDTLEPHSMTTASPQGPCPWLSADQSTANLLACWYKVLPTLREQGYTYTDVLACIKRTADQSPKSPPPRRCFYETTFYETATRVMRLLGFPDAFHRFRHWRQRILPSLSKMRTADSSIRWKIDSIGFGISIRGTGSYMACSADLCKFLLRRRSFSWSDHYHTFY